MNLVTRCPVCGTTFRAQREQLAAHFGTVRCGKCGGVFNGVAALVEEGADHVSIDPSPQLGLFDPSRRPTPAFSALDGTDMPAFLAPEAPARRRTWLWAAAVALAVLALAAQATYRYRAEIAAFAPETRATLDAACRKLGCAVPLPRHPERVTIESSDLQIDPRRENLIVLHAVIRNRSNLAQEYPALELTLTDDAGRPLLRRVLLPKDYVEAARLPQGLAAGGEAALRVYLDPSRAPVSSYRLYLFYPA
jgi:predicted Zn finger-like uncharacterized protein